LLLKLFAGIDLPTFGASLMWWCSCGGDGVHVLLLQQQQQLKQQQQQQLPHACTLWHMADDAFTYQMFVS
jgi:hypothetical protein